MNGGYYMADTTTIKIQKSTRDRLANIGTKRETYDAILQRLMDFYEADGKIKRDDSRRAKGAVK